jgi:hypothetical protein
MRELICIKTNQVITSPMLRVLLLVLGLFRYEINYLQDFVQILKFYFDSVLLRLDVQFIYFEYRNIPAPLSGFRGLFFFRVGLDLGGKGRKGSIFNIDILFFG